MLIGAGVLVARAPEPFRLMPDEGLLATSPGGLHVMVAATIEHGFEAQRVALLHMSRLFLVVLAIPILLRLLPGSTPLRWAEVDLSGERRTVIAGRCRS